MSLRRRGFLLPFIMIVAILGLWIPLWSEVLVTLSATTSPSAGQAGVHSINVTGSGFPSGTIPPANVTVTLEPATAGSGPTGSTPPLP